MAGKYAARTDREHWAKEIYHAHQIPLWSVARSMGTHEEENGESRA